MNWDDFRFFLALARTHTLSAAARELNVKHTTVSRRIAAFEQHLGARLFDHVKDGYVLTQSGENLYEHALVIEEQTYTVSRQVFGLDTELKGVINLTGAHQMLDLLVIPHLKLFRRAYPDIDLQLHASDSLADLSMREADIALRLTGNPPDYLVGKKVLSMRHGIYASTKYLRNPPQHHRAVVWRDDKRPEWLAQHFPKAEIALEVDHIGVVVSAIKNHMGIGRLPCLMGDSTTGLRRLDVPLTPSTWGVWVLSHADLRSTARVRVTREFLYDVVEQERALVEGLNSKYHN